MWKTEFVLNQGPIFPDCPDLYIPFGGYCYRTYQFPTDHEDAVQRCERDGWGWVGNGQLAKIDTFEKMFFIGETYQASWVTGLYVPWRASLALRRLFMA